MGRPGSRFTMGVARFVVVLSVVLIGAAGSLAAVTDGPAGAIATEVRPAAPVFLLADPGVSSHRTPPPVRSLSTAATRTASIAVNYLPWGSTDAWGEACYTWPSQAMSAFGHAASIWESLVTSSVPIVIDACWAELDEGYLGYGGPAGYYRSFTGAPTPNTWYPVALTNALLGWDRNGGDPEIHTTYSRTFDWYFGTDGNTPPTQYDFVSVVAHEIAHGLGFAGSMRWEAGSGQWGGGTGFPISYDRFTQDGAGNALINTAIYLNPSTALGSALTSNNVWFDGPSARTANGGGRVKLYAPSAWQSGSSYSHLDEMFNDTPNALMTHSLRRGESNHSPGPVAMGILKDMGWVTGDPGPPGEGFEILLPLVVRSHSTVGPSLTLYATGDTTILQGYPTANAGDTSFMWAGYDRSLTGPEGEIVRSLIQFDVGAIPVGTPIASAVLRVYVVESWPNSDRTRTMTAYGVNSAWSEMTVTWESSPDIGAAYGSTTVSSTTGQWSALDVTGLVRGWADGSVVNHGVMVRGPEHAGADAARRAFSTREGSHPPQLVITYGQ